MELTSKAIESRKHEEWANNNYSVIIFRICALEFLKTLSFSDTGVLAPCYDRVVASRIVTSSLIKFCSNTLLTSFLVVWDHSQLLCTVPKKSTTIKQIKSIVWAREGLVTAFIADNIRDIISQCLSRTNASRVDGRLYSTLQRIIRYRTYLFDCFHHKKRTTSVETGRRSFDIIKSGKSGIPLLIVIQSKSEDLEIYCI